MRCALQVPRGAARRRAAALLCKVPHMSRARGVLWQPEVRARLALGALWSPPRLIVPVRRQAVQCSAVQCSAVQCSAVQCSAVQCSAVQCSAVQCSAVQCSAVQVSVQQGGLDSSISVGKKMLAHARGGLSTEARGLHFLIIGVISLVLKPRQVQGPHVCDGCLRMAC